MGYAQKIANHSPKTVLKSILKNFKNVYGLWMESEIDTKKKQQL